MLFKLLEDYSPQPSDFVDQYLEVQGGQRILAPKQPGFTIMVHMLNDTPMLRTVSLPVHFTLICIRFLSFHTIGFSFTNYLILMSCVT